MKSLLLATLLLFPFIQNGQSQQGAKVDPLCLKSRTPGLDTVSTGSGSDLVSNQHAIFPNDCRLPALTRSLPLPVLTVSKYDFGLLRQSQVDPQFKSIVPKATWESIFFEYINERAGIAKLPSLRAALPKGDLELRLWNGFGLTALEGFVLRRRAGEWSAVHVDGIHPRLTKGEYEKQLSAPKSGWDEFWRKLVQMEIVTLPDADEIGCSGNALDGMSFVVELNYEFTYRTYMYDNPSYAKCKQAKKMIAIGNFIAAEFDVPEMATR